MKAELRSACRSAAVLLAAAGCYSEKDYAVDSTDPAKFIAFAAEQPVPTMQADGFSRIRLIATLPVSADQDKRTVVFSATGGTLIGGVTVGSTREVGADAEGKALVVLQSGTNVESIRIQAQLKGAPAIAAVLEVPVSAVVADSFFSFVQIPLRMDADGAGLADLRFSVRPRIPSDRRSVAVTATMGTFPTGTAGSVSVPADVSGNASTVLRSPTTTGTLRITATVAGVSRDTTLLVVAALPDTILVEPQKAKMTTAEEMTVVANLRRAIGTTTANTSVVFAAFDAAGLSVGRWRNVHSSGSNGQADAVFAPIGITVAGLVTLQASIPGTTKVGRTSIQVVLP